MSKTAVSVTNVFAKIFDPAIHNEEEVEHRQQWCINNGLIREVLSYSTTTSAVTDQVIYEIGLRDFLTNAVQLPPEQIMDLYQNYRMFGAEEGGADDLIALLKLPNTPANLLEEVRYTQGHYRFLEVIARHPNTSIDTLLSVIKNKNSIVASKTALKHPSLRREDFTELAENNFYLAEVISAPRMTETLRDNMRSLSVVGELDFVLTHDDISPEVHEAVIVEILSRKIQGESAILIADHPLTKLEKYPQIDNPKTRLASSRTPRHVLDSDLDSKEPEDFEFAYRNQNLTIDDLRKIHRKIPVSMYGSSRMFRQSDFINHVSCDEKLADQVIQQLGVKTCENEELKISQSALTTKTTIGLAQTLLSDSAHSMLAQNSQFPRTAFPLLLNDTTHVRNIFSARERFML